AKQVLSQLSYTPTERTTLILKHFPVFCPFLFISFDLDRAFTVHLFAYRAHCTVTVHIRSAIAWAISPAWRLRLCGFAQIAADELHPSVQLIVSQSAPQITSRTLWRGSAEKQAQRSSTPLFLLVSF